MVLWTVFGIFFIAGLLDGLFKVKVTVVTLDEAPVKPILTVIEGGKSAKLPT